MADVKKSLKDYGMQVLRALLDGQSASETEAIAKDLTLEDLPEETLRQEQIRLDIEERKLTDKLTKLDEQKRRLFDDAVKGGPSADRVAARKFGELKAEADNIDSRLEIISKRRRIINGLVRIKERGRHLKSGIFEQIPLVKLIPQIEEATVTGEIGEEELDQVLRTIEHNFQPSNKSSLSGEEEAFLQAVRTAREASDQRDIDKAFGTIKAKEGAPESRLDYDSLEEEK
jgi:hypothetical protein